MNIINTFKYGLWRFGEIICSKYNIYVFINARTGVKNINMSPLYSVYGCKKEPELVININPKNLFLGPDFLKDKYTLLDSCILESPHYYLMEFIKDGKDITKSEYYIRFTEGKLDSRHYQRKRKVSYFYDKYKSADNSIDDGSYIPVKVYLWKGRYYIYDGKHRAALCALKNKDVKCMLIPPICGEEMSLTDKEIYRIMAGDNNYSKHLKFIEDGKK